MPLTRAQKARAVRESMSDGRAPDPAESPDAVSTPAETGSPAQDDATPESPKSDGEVESMPEELSPHLRYLPSSRLQQVTAEAAETADDASLDQESKSTDGTSLHQDLIQSGESSSTAAAVNLANQGEDGIETTATSGWFTGFTVEIRLRILELLDDRDKFTIRWSCPGFLIGHLQDVLDNYLEPTYYCSRCKMVHDADYFSYAQKKKSDSERICRPIGGAVFLAPGIFLGWNGASQLREWSTQICHVPYLTRPDEKEKEPHQVADWSNYERNWDMCWEYPSLTWRNPYDLFRVQFDPGYRETATLKTVLCMKPPYVDRYHQGGHLSNPPIFRQDLEDWDFPLCPHHCLTSNSSQRVLRTLFREQWHQPLSGKHETTSGVELFCTDCGARMDFRFKKRDSGGARVIQVATLRKLGQLMTPRSWMWFEHCISEEETRVGRIWKEAMNHPYDSGLKFLEMEGDIDWLYDYLKGTQFARDGPMLPGMERAMINNKWVG